jgi:carboxylesterase type B
MVGYWTRFAQGGDPNGAGAPQWLSHTAASDLFQSLEPPTPRTGADFAMDHKCAFWDSP